MGKLLGSLQRLDIAVEGDSDAKKTYGQHNTRYSSKNVGV